MHLQYIGAIYHLSHLILLLWALLPFFISIVLKIMVRVDGTSERFTISDILWSFYCSSVLAAAACLNWATSMEQHRGTNWSNEPPLLCRHCVERDNLMCTLWKTLWCVLCTLFCETVVWDSILSVWTDLKSVICNSPEKRIRWLGFCIIRG